MPTINLKRPSCYNLAFLLARRYASAFILIGYIYQPVSVTGRCFMETFKRVDGSSCFSAWSVLRKFRQVQK